MQNIKNKTILLIGSGKDLEGRRLGKAIDENKAGYDLIARVNKLYGTLEDTGIYTDLYFARNKNWATFFLLNSYPWRKIHTWPNNSGNKIKEQAITFTDDTEFFNKACKELNVKNLSTGLLAAKWLIDKGGIVTVIGYGYKNENFIDVKTYAYTNILDNNPRYNWKLENEWLKKHVIMI